MKKNKLIYIYVLLLMVSSACEDLLDQEPESSVSSESFWKTEDDVNSAVYGMYNQFRATFDVKSVITGEFRTGFYGQGSSTATDWNDLWNNNMNSSSVGTNWSDYYLLINDANLILSKTPAIAFKDESAKEHVLGQAYFVRAYTYFKIVKLWGDAPVVTEGFESTDQDLEPPRSSKAQVFEQIKSDLNNATDLLGDRASVNYIGVDAANMLKADVYLWTAKVEGGGENDLLIAQEAVDNVLAAEYMLETDFEQAFRNEASSEIIFSVYYSDLETGSGSRNGSSGRSQNGTHPMHITLPSLELTPDELESQVPAYSSSQWLDLSDYFLNNILKPASVDSRTDVTWRSVSGSGQSVSWINKYIGEVVSGTRIASSDLIIYRFAEAILFKAEIESALGNTNEAIDQLNKIAKRAYGTDDYYDALSASQVDETILNERILEFVLEGKSWYDILRFQKAFEMIPTLIGREGDNEGNILLSPIAQDVLSRNRSIVQTDGY